jgi:hypothetical protein
LCPPAYGTPQPPSAWLTEFTRQLRFFGQL